MLEKHGARLMNKKGHSEADTQKPQGIDGCEGEKEFWEASGRLRLLSAQATVCVMGYFSHFQIVNCIH